MHDSSLTNERTVDQEHVTHDARDQINHHDTKKASVTLVGYNEISCEL